VVTRIDSTVSFAWGAGSPDAQIPTDYFSAQWTGYLVPPTTDTYTLIVESDDGCRLWVDGAVVINDWIPHSPKKSSVSLPFTAGQRHAIRLEYFERTGGAVARLKWSTSAQPEQVIPSACLRPQDALSVAIPRTSFTSPACIEGFAPGSAGAVSFTSLSGIAPARKLSESAFYADVALNAYVPMPVLVRNGNAAFDIGLVRWQSINLSEPPSSDEFIIRRDDSLLFTTSHDGTIVIDGTGYFSSVGGTRKPITRGLRIPVKFNQPGWHSVAFIGKDGSVTAPISVLAVGLSLDPALAGRSLRAKVGSQRTYAIPVLPADASNQVAFFTATSRIDVNTDTPSEAEAKVRFTPMTRGDLVIGARLGTSGPILSTAGVEEYEVIHRNRLDTPVEDFGPGRTSIARSQIEIRPFIPGVRFDFDMFASKSVFFGNTKRMTATLGQPTTSSGAPGWTQMVDAQTGEAVGILTLDVYMPLGENKMCYHTSIFANIP
jgi:hypothetical protein